MVKKRKFNNVCLSDEIIKKKKIELLNLKIQHKRKIYKLKEKKQEIINQITMEKLLLEKKRNKRKIKTNKISHKKRNVITYKIK